MSKSKFLGETKGNRDRNINRSSGENGGSGESHAGRPSGKFLGSSKGNRDLPPERTSGVSGGYGGKSTQRS